MRYSPCANEYHGAENDLVINYIIEPNAFQYSLGLKVLRRRVQFGSNYVYIFQNVLQTYLEFPTFLPLEGLNYPTAEFMRNVTQHDCENTIFWLPVSTA